MDCESFMELQRCPFFLLFVTMIVYLIFLPSIPSINKGSKKSECRSIENPISPSFISACDVRWSNWRRQCQRRRWGEGEDEDNGNGSMHPIES